MSALNFARRPFRNERPVFLVAGILLIVAAAFLVINVRLYVDYQRSVEGTTLQIDRLEKRKADALARAQQARSALDSYRVSNLASESKALLRIVSERRFSWIALLARLEHVLPAEVRVSRLTPHFENAGVTVSLGLVGKDGDSVVRTVAALARDPVFSVVVLRSEATQEQGVPEGRSFEVDLRYSAPEPSGDRPLASGRKDRGR